MFQNMNPNDLPGADWQHWLMWIVAGALGFVIGYLGRQEVIRQLEADLTTADRALADCRRSSR
jgi:hypothetical protein